MLHQPSTQFQPAPHLISALASPRQTDRSLIALCGRAIAALAEDHRLELALSDLSDSFMDIPKPAKPDMGPFPSRYYSMTAKEMRDEVKRLRSVKPEMRTTWNNGLLATGAYQNLIKDMASYEAEMLRLKTEHGLHAIEQASAKANRQSCRLVADIASIAAITSAGVAAKCRAMKACLDAGYGHYDEFEDLATSIYADGALL